MSLLLVDNTVPDSGMRITKRSALLGLYNLTIIENGMEVKEYVIDSKEAADLALKIIKYLDEEDAVLKDSFIKKLRDQGLAILARIVNRTKAISR